MRRMARNAQLVTPPAQHRPDHARCLAVGIRLPGMHRRQSHLGAVADQQQDERRMQPGLGQLRRMLQKVLKSERGFESRMQRGIGQKEGAQQRQGDADRADQQVFPGGFDAALASG